MFRALALTLSAAALAVTAQVSHAGDCTGYVVNVRPLSQYNHAKGHGFLAVRTGPGSKFQQLSELYLGDEIAVWERSGNWYHVQCMTGRCRAPLWGQADANGWVYGKYLDIGGVCP